MDYDELLDALLGCSIQEEVEISKTPEKEETYDMIIEEPPKQIEKKPKFIFNCIEDNETYYPDVVARRRYGGYKPPKAPKVKFIDPFAVKVETPAYSKQVYDSMERLRIRDNDKRDSKIKYIKKKYPND